MIRFATAFAAALALVPAVATPPAEQTAPPRNPFDASEIEIAFTMPDVDVELVLMADVSSSMDSSELRQQRDGYIAALRSPQVAAAVTDGALGKVAIAYAEFAGSRGQVMVGPWAIVDGPETLASFAAVIAAAPPRPPALETMPGSYGTSVGGAITFAALALDANGLVGERAVIDVSGDGEDNSSEVKAASARDVAASAGITINGLPIVGDDATPGLEAWYSANVIGGPGAFVVPVVGFANFGEAVRRKLVMEIAGREPETMHAGL